MSLYYSRDGGVLSLSTLGMVVSLYYSSDGGVPVLVLH